MNKEHVRVEAEGFLSTHEQDALQALLKNQHLIGVTIKPVREQEPDQERAPTHEHEPSLGYMTFKELHAFFAAQSDTNLKDRTDARLWSLLARESNASKTPKLSSIDLSTEGNVPRGKIGINEQLLEVFHIGSEAGPDATISYKKDRMADHYKLNLDTLAIMITDNEDSHWLSPEAEELAKRVVESRRQSLEDE